MPAAKYLIIGGGMTASAAIEGIRSADKTGAISLIGSDTHPPYNRPPLTKGLWKGDAFESIWRETDGVELHFGRTIHSLNPERREAVDDQGTAYNYEKLLLATGAAPRQLRFGGDRIVYFRTLDDYQRLRLLSAEGERFLVIGAGFIGSEIAAALSMNGRQVTLAFPGEGISDRIFPPGLTRFVNDYYRNKGVEVIPGTEVVGVEERGRASVARVREKATGRESEIEVDGVVAGVGVDPNVDLAQMAGLQVENGVRVNPALQTSRPEIYAAGDVAEFHNPALDQWMRVEHEDNANTMGAAAGQSMAGQPVTYDHLPFFYSDLFDLGYEAVGDLDSRLEIVEDWKTPNEEGAVYYLKDGRVRGVLLWNVWEQVDAARALIAEKGRFDAASLRGRLPA